MKISSIFVAFLENTNFISLKSYQNRQRVIWTDLPGRYLSQFGAADGELDDDTEIGDAFEIGLIFDDRRQEGRRLK